MMMMFRRRMTPGKADDEEQPADGKVMSKGRSHFSSFLLRTNNTDRGHQKEDADDLKGQIEIPKEHQADGGSIAYLRGNRWLLHIEAQLR